MSLTDEQCRAMETWADKKALEEISALRAESAKLKARVEAAEELIRALRWHLKEEHMASRNLFSGKITPGHREAQTACYAASAAWEALK